MKTSFLKFGLIIVGFLSIILAMTTFAMIKNSKNFKLCDESNIFSDGDNKFPCPASWQIQEVHKSNPKIIKLYKITDDEELGDFNISIYENPDNLALKEFYDGIKHPNLFADAIGGYQSVKIKHIQATQFNNVLGFTHYTIIVFSYNGKIFEITDVGEKHQSDGLYRIILTEFIEQNL